VCLDQIILPCQAGFIPIRRCRRKSFTLLPLHTDFHGKPRRLAVRCPQTSGDNESSFHATAGWNRYQVPWKHCQEPMIIMPWLQTDHILPGAAFHSSARGWHSSPCETPVAGNTCRQNARCTGSGQRPGSGSETCSRRQVLTMPAALSLDQTGLPWKVSVQAQAHTSVIPLRLTSENLLQACPESGSPNPVLRATSDMPRQQRHLPHSSGKEASASAGEFRVGEHRSAEIWPGPLLPRFRQPSADSEPSRPIPVPERERPPELEPRERLQYG